MKIGDTNGSDFEQAKKAAIARLEQAGIHVQKGSKKPAYGMYSSIVGTRREPFVIRY
ncbi:hypothetical protein [Paenibacillus taiwanensis]|uniref:hypothetical protein n=1 Tax=Paenibacillus taiwanensis TaxID=401638 RepID=UPI0003FEC28B|nr:hypothetical protein [Paenibacillus taiwanensis]